MRPEALASLADLCPNQFVVSSLDERRRDVRQHGAGQLAAYRFEGELIRGLWQSSSLRPTGKEGKQCFNFVLENRPTPRPEPWIPAALIAWG